MDEATRLLLLFGTLVPLGTAAVLAAFPGRRTAALRGVAALVLGYVLAHGLGQPSWPALPPQDVTDWPLWLALLGAPLALLERETTRAALRHAVPPLACGAGAYALLAPKLGRMQPVEAGAWLAGSAALWVGGWYAARRAARAPRGEALVLFEWSLVASAAAVCLHLSGSQVLARLAAGLAPPLAVAAAWVRWRPAVRLAPFLVPAWSLALGAHLLNGVAYSSLTGEALGALGAGLVLVALLPRPTLRGAARAPLVRALGHLILVVGPLVFAGVHEFRTHLRSGGLQDYLDALERGTLPVEQDDDYGYDDEPTPGFDPALYRKD